MVKTGATPVSQEENKNSVDVHILEGPSFVFYQAYFSWRRITDKALETVGLTHTQYIFLCTLASLEKQGQSPTQNDLALLTNSDATMTSQILRALQKRGFIERTHIEGDERAKYPRLLASGKKLVKTAAKIMEQTEKEYFAPLEKNFQQFIGCLKDLTRPREENQ
jgi:DNA-binding MarR family transcriptional regulator